MTLTEGFPGVSGTWGTFTGVEVDGERFVGDYAGVYALRLDDTLTIASGSALALNAETSTLVGLVLKFPMTPACLRLPSGLSIFLILPGVIINESTGGVLKNAKKDRRPINVSYFGAHVS